MPKPQERPEPRADKHQTGETILNAEKEKIIVDAMASFIGHTVKILPDDVGAKLRELSEKETDPAAMAVYETMFRNLRLAEELDRPLCQDTGVVQFWVRCGSGFPMMNEMERLLTEAVRKATHETPLRPNCVETFSDVNTGNNVGKGVPVIWWDIVPDRDDCEIYTYYAGGGCSLPGKAEVFMPGAGYKAIIPFVLDRVTEYGLNACPPLLIGVGVGNSVETAAMNSKKALMRSVDSVSDDPKAAEMEKLLEEGVNAIGLGPQGFGGSSSVLGVNIVNTPRHPATLGVAVNFGCWAHRRGAIVFDRDLGFRSTTHSGFKG